MPSARPLFVALFTLVSLVGCASKDPNEKLAKKHSETEQAYYYRAQKP